MKRFLLFFLSLGLIPSLYGASNTIPYLRIADSINVGTSELIKRALTQAQEQKLPAVFIELDTPGGFLEATRDIVQLLLNSQTPVVIWIAPPGARAASAGAMITMSAHYAAMAPSTSIGAATPVTGSGEQLSKEMQAKINNDTLSFVEGIARKRGRNIEWARKSVSDAASLSSEDAVKQNVVDGVFNSRTEVWKAARTKFSQLPQDPDFVDFSPLISERFLSFLSNPNIAYGLLGLGALGLYVELTHPGLIVPGTIGVFSLLLGAMTMKIMPIRPAAIALLIFAFILFWIEIFTPAPTYGVAGFVGLVCLFLSGMFLIDTAQSDLNISATLWLPAFVLISLLIFLFGYIAVKALRTRSAGLGAEALLGKIGYVVATDDKTQRATVEVQGELWAASWDKTLKSPPPFTKNMPVRVVEQKDLLIYVAPEAK